jgi:hypothetical protein
MNDDNTTWIVLAGAIVIIGKWSQGKGMDAPAVIALAFLALMVAIMGNIDATLARYLTILILIVAVITYGPKIISKLGLSKKAISI